MWRRPLLRCSWQVQAGEGRSGPVTNLQLLQYVCSALVRCVGYPQVDGSRESHVRFRRPRRPRDWRRMKSTMQEDMISNRARADLLVRTEQGDEDALLWEHSLRVSTNARRIMQLPAVQAKSPDEAVIVAAALYHAAGWIIRFRAFGSQAAPRSTRIFSCPVSTMPSPSVISSS